MWVNARDIKIESGDIIELPDRVLLVQLYLSDGSLLCVNTTYFEDFHRGYAPILPVSSPDHLKQYLDVHYGRQWKLHKRKGNTTWEPVIRLWDVICTDNYRYEDDLTIGNVYKVVTFDRDHMEIHTNNLGNCRIYMSNRFEWVDKW